MATNKPVFLWWAHKLMWDAIAGYPMWLSGVHSPNEVKQDIIHKLVKAFRHEVDATPLLKCYACAATSNGVAEECDRCPLEWGTNEAGISRSCKGFDSLYKQWELAWSSRNPMLARKLAEEIRDLPLTKRARRMYAVKEVPYAE